MFAGANSGFLTVAYVDGNGVWNGPETWMNSTPFPPGAAVAASRRFGKDQTDVFVIDKNGQLTVSWVDGAGVWNGPQPIGNTGIFPPGAPLAASQQFGLHNQTDVFAVANSGFLTVAYVDGNGVWNGPET